MAIEVTALMKERPSAISVELDRSLDDPSLYFVVRATRGFQPIAMPPIGGTLFFGREDESAMLRGASYR